MRMNLNQFLMKIFTLFPPEATENSAELLQMYLTALTTTKQIDYDRALAAFPLEYKYRKLPTVATIADFLNGFTIKKDVPLEIHDIIAWKGKYQYVFAYNAAEESYFEVKYRLQQKGLTVNDTEQRVYD